MKTILKKLFLYILSVILWITWWTVATFVVINGIIISLIIPKKFYNSLVKIVCHIMMYCVLLFPKQKGIDPKKIPFPVIFVANHVTFFDLFISGSVLPGYPRGFELEEHFFTPIYGWFITRFGQIPIDLKNRTSIKKSFIIAVDVLKNKVRNIFIEPEGHRTKDGKINVFKSGAFYLSRKSGIPIVPILYKRLYDRNNKNSLLIIPGTFDVIILPPVYPDKFSKDVDMARFVRDLMVKKLEGI